MVTQCTCDGQRSQEMKQLKNGDVEGFELSVYLKQQDHGVVDLTTRQ